MHQWTCDRTDEHCEREQEIGYSYDGHFEGVYHSDYIMEHCLVRMNHCD